MLKILTATAVLIGTAASAQVTSYKASNAAPLDGEPNKIVCKKEEKVGTRLGAKKVCMTVAEWNELAREHREQTQRIQAGACMVGEGQACLEPN